MKTLFLRIWTIFNICITIFKLSHQQVDKNRCFANVSMEDFNKSKFTGIWYVVKDSAQSFTCTKHAISQSSNWTSMIDKVTSLPVVDMASHFDRPTLSTMSLSNPDAHFPGLMELNTTWKLDPKNWIVFETDYKNYAGVLLCNPQPIKYLGYVSTINIFSRRPQLKNEDVKNLERKMKELDILPDKLFNVDHGMCDGGHKNFKAELDEFLERASN